MLKWKRIQFLPRDAMHKRGLCRHAVSVSVSVCAVTFVDHVKTNKHIFKNFSPSGSPTILVFPNQTGWRYSDGNPPDGGVECRWGRQNTRFWTNIWLRCIQVYTVVNRTSREVWIIKPRRTAASVEHTAASVVRCLHTRRRRSVCDRLDFIRRRRGQTPTPAPDTTTLVITAFPRFLLP